MARGFFITFESSTNIIKTKLIETEIHFYGFAMYSNKLWT